MKEVIVDVPQKAELSKHEQWNRFDTELLNELILDEAIELVTLYKEIEALEARLTQPDEYLCGLDEDMFQTNIHTTLRPKIARVEELLSGYPQTGSAASAVRRALHATEPLNADFRLEYRIHYFDSISTGIHRGERAAFGDGALSSAQVNYYTRRDARYDSPGSPLVAGHLLRPADAESDRDKLYSYMLVLREPNPDGKTMFEQRLPEGADYLDGIWVDEQSRGAHLATELLDYLLANADTRPVYASVKAINFKMMHLLSRMGKNRQDANYVEGPHAGRSRAIELLYWPNYFDEEFEGDRVMTMYDPGIFIPDSVATIRADDVVDVNDIGQYLGRDRIAIPNAPPHNSIGRERPERVDGAVYRLLDSGYIGIPLGNYRLFVRIDSLPERTARNILRRYEEVDAIRQLDIEKSANKRR